MALHGQIVYIIACWKLDNLMHYSINLCSKIKAITYMWMATTGATTQL